MPGKPFSHKQKKLQQQEKRRERQARDLQASTEGKVPSDEEPQEEGNEEEENHEKEPDLSYASAVTHAEQILRSLVLRDTDEEIEARRKNAYLPLTHRKFEAGIPPIRWTGLSETFGSLPLPLEGITEDEARFQDWIRTTAAMPQTSYFEVNAEIWHQLYKAVDQCSVLGIVVDVRYVPFHLADNFMEYARSRRPIVVVLNKIDLVPQSAVDAWTGWIKKKYGTHIEVLPFTCNPNPTGVTANVYDDIAKRRHAKTQGSGTFLQKINKEKKPKKAEYQRARHAGQGDLQPLGGEGSDSEDETEDAMLRVNKFKGQEKISQEDEGQRVQKEKIATELAKVTQNIDALLNVAKMLTPCGNEVRLAMVGQPNVGKSSIINALCGIKKVSVSATPGHTKHVATIPMETTQGHPMVLLDCPGLIFPCCHLPRSVAQVCGIFPFAQNREHFSAVAYIAERLPLERIYALTKIYDDEEQWSSYEIAEAVAVVKGFYLSRGKGRPDAHRGAHSVLMDAFLGRLVLYYVP